MVTIRIIACQSGVTFGSRSPGRRRERLGTRAQDPKQSEPAFKTHLHAL
jgi:hypothetical protein